MRGEYLTIVSTSPPMRELPPRTRRIHFFEVTRVDDSGTTSAYAENTSKNGARTSSIQNYLRVRGEYRIRLSIVAGAWELPPRTRRILPFQAGTGGERGTTSAHAENTARMVQMSGFWWNYLRARGEYGKTRAFSIKTKELPPRTRRIHLHSPVQINFLGTTSAHAENTLIEAQAHITERNYLRARGEYLNELGLL